MSAYQKIDESVPAYGNRAPTYELRAPTDEVNLEAQMQPQPRRTEIVIPVLYVKEIHACCIVISALNFICCSWMGIPALIFTILGIEADTRRDRASAERHRLYMFIFNLIGCILFVTIMSIYVIAGVAYGLVIVAVESANRY